LAFPGLHRARWLFPVELPLRQTGMGLMASTGVRGFVGRHLAASRWFWGDRIWLDVAPLEHVLAQALGEPEVRLAFSLGTSGAYRKLTVQIMTARRAVPAYAKIAEHPLAQGSLAREHDTLIRLSAADALCGRVPKVLAWFPWGGARVLLVTAGEGKMGSSRLMAGHVEFLLKLQRVFLDQQPFEASPMWRRIVATARRLDSLMPGQWSARYQRALNRLSDTLGVVTLPLSLAHRDFAPWNIRVAPQGLFVFDWEAATDGTAPLYDVLHFQAIQDALLGRPFQASLRHIDDVLTTLWPDGRGYLPELWLAYLTDMGLYYTEARLQRPETGDERVWRWFGRQIDASLGGSHAVA
jgi:hypothetical protein